jgi:hypothetical protein
MDSRFIGDLSHFSTQGIDFLDKLALGQTTDSRIARHKGNRVQIYIKQDRGAAHPCRRQGSLTSGMTTPDNNNIVISLQTLNPVTASS